MAFYADLSTVTQAACGPHVRAIGWLAKSHEFTTGTSSPAFVERLAEFVARAGHAEDALGLPHLMGPHRCELCEQVIGIQNLGVVWRSVVFIAPELVHHYVVAHAYLPPAEFVEAVLLAPLPDSPEFLQLARQLPPFQWHGCSCPKCGERQLTVSSAVGFHHQRCNSCGHEEGGTFSYPGSEEDLVEMRVLVRCASAVPTADELAALRRIFPELATVSLKLLRARLSAEPQLVFGPVSGRVATALVTRAGEAGLIARAEPVVDE